MSPVELSGRALGASSRDAARFVDREQEVEAALNALRNGANALILGARGSGKSSLLRFIKHRLAEAGQIAAAVDGRAAADEREFLALLRDAFGAWPRATAADAAAAVAAGLRPLVGGEMVFAPAPSETSSLMRELSSVRASLPPDAGLVLVDEMPSPEAAHTLFGRLRDELWELPLTWLVVANARDAASYTSPPADAFWQRVLTLGPLADVAALELLKRRLDGRVVHPDTLNRIVEQAAGNPRTLISLAYDVVVEGRPAAVALRRQAAFDESSAQLTEPARELLVELQGSGPAGPSDEWLLRRFGWSRSRASQLFGELERQGLVQVSQRPGRTGRPRNVYEVVR
jgi:AAA ATPase domain